MRHFTRGTGMKIEVVRSCPPVNSRGQRNRCPCLAADRCHTEPGTFNGRLTIRHIDSRRRGLLLQKLTIDKVCGDDILNRKTN